MSAVLRKRNKPPVFESSNQNDASLPSYEEFFSERRTVSIDEGDDFCVHIAGDVADAGYVFVLLHGAGQNSLSFALFVAALQRQLPNAAAIAIDLRAHGLTRTADETDLSLTQMCDDVRNVLSQILPNHRVRLVLVGHSAGAAFATRLAGETGSRLALNIAPHTITALIVFDAVEEAAIESLAETQQLLATRPTLFESVAAAATWCVHTAQLPRNAASAAVSVPNQLSCEKANLYTWRTPLADVLREFAPEWFRGMSDDFLRVRVPKLLVLAAPTDSVHGGAERLDAKLTVGHMQVCSIVWRFCNHSYSAMCRARFSWCFVAAATPCTKMRLVKYRLR